jgi:hypothetical protein
MFQDDINFIIKDNISILSKQKSRQFKNAIAIGEVIERTMESVVEYLPTEHGVLLNQPKQLNNVK